MIRSSQYLGILYESILCNQTKIKYPQRIKSLVEYFSYDVNDVLINVDILEFNELKGFSWFSKQKMHSGAYRVTLTSNASLSNYTTIPVTITVWTLFYFVQKQKISYLFLTYTVVIGFSQGSDYKVISSILFYKQKYLIGRSQWYFLR